MAVYFVVEDTLEFCKVGRAHRPENRLREMQIGCPFELQLFATIERVEGESKFEAELHRRLKGMGAHHRGEWFEAPAVAGLLACDLRLTEDHIDFFESPFAVWDLAQADPRYLEQYPDEVRLSARHWAWEPNFDHIARAALAEQAA